MQLTMFDDHQETTSASSYGKTYPECSAQKTMPSAAFWQGLPAKVSRCSQQGRNGRTLVVCLDPKEQSRGGCSMPNISEWPNDAAVCLLSQVLETGSIPAKYFLSSKACAGILRRAEKRGKRLPLLLEQALQAAVSGMGGQLTQTLDAVLHKGQTMPEKNRFPAVLQPIAFPANLSGTQCASAENIAPVIGATNPTAVALSLRGRDGGGTAELGDEVQNCLRASGGGVMMPNMKVRRLTPRECERLQGMPDDHTLVPHRGKAAVDGPRYKAIGNSMAVPCMEFIGRRIQEQICPNRQAGV